MPQLVKTLGADPSAINVGLITHLFLIPVVPELVVLDPVRWPGASTTHLAPGNIIFDQTREVADVRLVPGAAKWTETLVGANGYSINLTAALHGNDANTRAWLDQNSSMTWLAAVRQTDGKCFLLGDPDSGGLGLTWSRAVEGTQIQQFTLSGTCWHLAWGLPSLDPTVLFGSEAEFDIAFDSSFKIS